MTLRKFTTAAAVLALAATPAAFAKGKPEDPGSQGKGKSEQNKGKAKPKNVVLKGTVVGVAEDGTVTVHVAKATKWGRFLKDSDAAFTVAKVNVADTNGDGQMTVADLVAGDKVVVQARLAKDDVAPYKARRVVDQTHPKPSDDDEQETPAPAPAV